MESGPSERRWTATDRHFITGQDVGIPTRRTSLGTLSLLMTAIDGPYSGVSTLVKAPLVVFPSTLLFW
jgi:hypothetical protein